MTSLWHPFFPPGIAPELRIVRGEGSYVYDDLGRAYLNAAGGLWNVTLGLDHKELLERIEAQQHALAYSPLFYASHRPAETLSTRLLERAGYIDGATYLSASGTSAVEVAVRVARLYHRVRGQPSRRRILTFDRSYHGCSLLNLSASGLERATLKEWDEVLDGFDVIPSPYCYRCPLGKTHPACQHACLEQLSQVLSTEGNSVAALMVEPILGSGGIVVPPDGYWPTVTDLCQTYGVLLIADEVATGGGRCGTMFASHALGLAPDIITLSKGINSGYFPLGATLFSKGVISPIKDVGAPLLYGSTQDGNPVACTAALATLDIIQSQNLIERANVMGEQLVSRLKRLVGTGVVGQVRGLGLMIGIELVHNSPPPRTFTDCESARVRQLCQVEGLLVYHFESGISLFPPLTLSESEAEEIVDTLAYVLDKVATQAVF